MWTVFFDIDCTLLRSGGSGLETIRQLMHERYDIDKLPDIELHGRTDFGIWQELFEKLNIAFPDDLSPMIDSYCTRLETEIGNFKGQLMPGVPDVLARLQPRDDIALGLLTGNAKRAAMIKVEHFGLAEYFQPFGGFGDQHPDRNDVAAQARQSAQEHLGDRFDPDKMWVVGDTIRDVECGQSIGAKVIAVATGNQTLEFLRESNPDLAVSDLTDGDLIEKTITGSN